jgi:histidine ammonia-lyase
VAWGGEPLAGGARVYGVNTGMGWLASVDLGPADQEEHQRNLLEAGRSAGRRGAARGPPPGRPSLGELVAPVDRDRPLGPDLERLIGALERDELPLS